MQPTPEPNLKDIDKLIGELAASVAGNDMDFDDDDDNEDSEGCNVNDPDRTPLYEPGDGDKEGEAT